MRNGETYVLYLEIGPLGIALDSSSPCGSRLRVASRHTTSGCSSFDHPPPPPSELSAKSCSTPRGNMFSLVAMTSPNARPTATRSAAALMHALTQSSHRHFGHGLDGNGRLRVWVRNGHAPHLKNRFLTSIALALCPAREHASGARRSKIFPHSHLTRAPSARACWSPARGEYPASPARRASPSCVPPRASPPRSRTAIFHPSRPRRYPRRRPRRTPGRAPRRRDSSRDRRRVGSPTRVASPPTARDREDP